MRVATVCRDEGAGEVCMRGTVATKAIRVCMCALEHGFEKRIHTSCCGLRVRVLTMHHCRSDHAVASMLAIRRK